MNLQELEGIVEEYRNKSEKIYPSNEEKAVLYERIANQLEDNINDYVDSEYFTTEEDVINAIKESLDEVDNFYSEEDYDNMDMLDY